MAEQPAAIPPIRLAIRGWPYAARLAARGAVLDHAAEFRIGGGELLPGDVRRDVGRARRAGGLLGACREAGKKDEKRCCGERQRSRLRDVPLLM
jgi:hypothetical protein